MIKILQNWREIGDAIGYLNSLGDNKLTRIYHTNPVKNWDMAQIASILRNKPKNIKILDMGCGGSSVLRFCFKNKFKYIYGIDLTIDFHDRWQQLMYWKNNNYRLPYHLSVQSVTKTNFKNHFFDILICLSVIEHNVILEKFICESSRILKKGGYLYVSTDYWENKINTFDSPVNYGIKPGKDWSIFSKQEIKNFILIAGNYGLELVKKEFPQVKQQVINWNSKNYTFISILFIKK